MALPHYPGTFKRTYRFYKANFNQWYCDIPEWLGSVSDLEMVSGADTMLDYFAKGETEVFLTLSTDSFTSPGCLKFIEEDKNHGGAWYILESYGDDNLNLKMWLCDVTKFVFGYLPKKIYIQQETKL